MCAIVGYLVFLLQKCLYILMSSHWRLPDYFLKVQLCVWIQDWNRVLNVYTIDRFKYRIIYNGPSEAFFDTNFYSFWQHKGFKHGSGQKSTIRESYFNHWLNLSRAQNSYFVVKGLEITRGKETASGRLWFKDL